MNPIFIIFMVVLQTCVSNDSPDVFSYYHNRKHYDNIIECEEALGNFSRSSASFTQCSINYSRPIRMCEFCVGNYIAARNDYRTILTITVNGTKCRSILMDLDRIQIVYNTYQNILTMWNNAYCDKCFTWKNDTPVLSNETEQFISLFNDAKQCINDHFEDHHLPNNTDIICKDCMEQYVKLNDYYESLKGPKETINVCYDIVDSMNATRAIWSNVLDCCKLRKTPEVYFLLSTAAVSLIPVGFYFLAQLYCEGTKRRVTEQSRYATSFRGEPGTSLN